jgi:hypothetical protein
MKRLICIDINMEIISLKDFIQGKLESLKKLTKESDKIFLSPEGEELLVQVLEYEKEIEQIKDEIKVKLEESALKIDPNFSSIQADKVKVYYREYGSKYYVDETQTDLLPEGLAQKKIVYTVDSKAVEDWVNEKGAMPTGIRETPRTKSMSFSLKNHE